MKTLNFNIKLILVGLLLMSFFVVFVITVTRYRDKRYMLSASLPEAISISYYENFDWMNPTTVEGNAEIARQFISLLNESRVTREIKDGPFGYGTIKLKDGKQFCFSITDTPMIEFDGYYYKVPKEKLSSIINSCSPSAVPPPKNEDSNTKN